MAWLLATTLAGVAVIDNATPAAAELSSTGTTSWGVSGLATGTFTDTIKSPVWAIEQIGNRIYVGGKFTTVTNGTQSVGQPFLAAFDATTGAHIPSFAPTLNNAVYALEAAPDGSKLFVGGAFTTINGSSATGLAAINPTTGALDEWSGRIGGYNLVRNLDLVGGWLYVGGSFSRVSNARGRHDAWKVARFNVENGTHDPRWRPVVAGGSVWGIAASSQADRVYLAGTFTSVNGVSSPGGFQAVTATTGRNVTGVQSFKVNTTTPERQWLYDVVVTDGSVFTAGSEHFVQVLNESDLSLKKFHISEPNRGDYQDLEVVGDRVYASCHCRLNQTLNSADGIRWFGAPPPGVQNAPITHRSPNSWVMAIDVKTGLHVDTFVPDINSANAGPWAIHGSPDGCLWLGGNITAAGGVAQRHLTRLCEANMVADNQRPTTPGRPQIQTVAANSVSLAWKPSRDNVGVAGYRIFDKNSNAVLLDASGTTGTITNLAPGTYQIYNKAYDAAGNLSYRSGVTTITIGGQQDTQRPSTPRGLKIAGGNANLSWSASTDNVGVVGYRVFNRATNTVIVDVSTTSATVNVPAGTTLFVRAYDAAGNLSWRTNLVTT